MDRSHLMQVADIERACFSHPWSLELLEQELYNDMLSLIVAEGEDGTVLGYGEVRAILDEGTLEKIAVAPAYRRQGVAEAIALYEKLGFEPVGRRKNYYRQLHEDALLMTRTFRPAG